MPVNATPVKPVTMIIFGATGNLSTTRLIPAIFHLYAKQYTPRDFHVLGVARRPLSTKEFRAFLGRVVGATYGKDFPADTWKQFSSQLSYLPVDFEKGNDFRRLCDWISFHDRENPRSKLYYLAVAPQFYLPIFTHLKTCAMPVRARETWTRVIVEKPFGSDFATAERLNEKLEELFGEGEIYRIDHYLGKETVQNILAFRFANGFFEPMWNRHFIDHVQISVAEEEGVGMRGAFYDAAGALRDVGQNHLLQLLANIAMENPKSLRANDLRNARASVLKRVRPGGREIAEWTCRGQYSGYRKEKDVDPRSTTETFIALKLFVDTARWRGVPFYLRTGKGLPRRVSEVSIQFQKPRQKLFGHVTAEEVNVLTLRIQPDEGIALRLNIKVPEHGQELKPVEMNFCYDQAFHTGKHEAYDTLLLDAMHGDQSLFPRIDEVMTSWRIVSPILATWEHGDSLHIYQKGSWGPMEADQLIRRDGREWLTLKLIVCDIHR